MVIYKATKKDEPLYKEPKTWQILIVQVVAFIVIVSIGAILGALICFNFALLISLVTGNGLDGFSLVLNNNLTYFSAFGGVLFALMLLTK